MQIFQFHWAEKNPRSVSQGQGVNLISQKMGINVLLYSIGDKKKLKTPKTSILSQKYTQYQRE